MKEIVSVVMLCGDGLSSRVMYNGLASCYDVDIKCVILEKKPSSKTMIQRRIKKIGVVKTIGQLFFIATNKIIAMKSSKRIKHLIFKYNINDSAIPKEILKQVNSINDKEVISLIKEKSPDVIIVNGTRIISQEILSSIAIPFVNTHMGITPKYRGVHGGYWALANKDHDNCGVTVHLVDKGIDTGGILYQDRIAPDHQDNFNTYPIHQIAKAIPLMKKAICDIKENKINIQHNNGPSYLWYHPTLFEYIKYWIKNGAK